jgi:hypothetical protein
MNAAGVTATRSSLRGRSDERCSGFPAIAAVGSGAASSTDRHSLEQGTTIVCVKDQALGHRHGIHLGNRKPRAEIDPCACHSTMVNVRD